MDILQSLKFVQGAVSTKDLVPEMKHYAIEGGTVRAFNGMMALGSPIDFDVDCQPQAVPLAKAIANCEDVASLGMTPNGRLRVASGGFRAYIDCIEGIAPHATPEGDEVEIDGEALMAAVALLGKFIGDDATRPWANGILLRGTSAYATNNVCLVEYWIGADLPFVANIPIKTVKEMQRIKEPPTHAQLCDHSITFHYTDGRWLRTQLFSTEWPEAMYTLLERPAEPLPVPEGFFDGLANIKPFADKLQRVYFDNGQLATHLEEGVGARYAVEGLHKEGLYRVPMLQLLEDVATAVDFGGYPGPAMFYGDRVRGAIIGLRS